MEEGRRKEEQTLFLTLDRSTIGRHEGTLAGSSTSANYYSVDACCSLQHLSCTVLRSQPIKPLAEIDMAEK